MNFRRIFIFGLWLALGVVGIGIVLPELNRARSSMDQQQMFENIASDLPSVATGTPNDSKALDDLFSSPSGGTSGNSEGSLGLSGVGQGGGGTSSGLGIGIGSMGAGASATPNNSDDAKTSSVAPQASAASGNESGPLGLSGNIGKMEGYGRGQGIGGGGTAPGAGRITAPKAEPQAAMAAPPSSEPAAAETDDLMAELDRKLASLPLANIAFNTPETIPLGDDAMIELLLSLQETEEQLRDAIRAAGPTESARIQISDQMEARLTGLGFRIEAITPDRQAVSRGQRTWWRWQIEPTKSDTLALHLTLSAIVTIDGVPAPRTVQTFERTIYVDVPLATQVTQFAKNNVEIITTFFLIPVVGGLYRHVRNKKRQTAMPEFGERPRRAA